MLATASQPVTEAPSLAARRPATTADQIRTLAFRYRAAGTLLDQTIAGILEDAASDLDYSRAETWAEHKARLEVLTKNH